MSRILTNDILFSDHHASSDEADIAGTYIFILFKKFMFIALDPVDEGGWDADDEDSYVDEAASPWSDVTWEYDYRLHRGGSDYGQYSNAALDAGGERLRAQAAREHEELLRKPRPTPVMRVPLWIVEGILNGKYPNSALKYLLKPNADGKIEYKIGLDNGGFVEFKLRGRPADPSNNPQSSDHETAQEPHRNDDAIGQYVVEGGIGSSSASALSGSTIQENTLWYDPNCSQRVRRFSYSSQHYGRVLGSGDERARFGFEFMIALFLPSLFLFFPLFC